ncbi:MAG: Rne/Rng family ribonuclease [Myxococcaceae bacterium]|nr:Rne/Rng family ribonuclease [Myxococcaceae bacterium]MBH2006881.1 Rne/Rng family ribonuclease [Myxococcaceae bacterium]
MTHQLLVNTTSFETRVALLENGQLVELLYERKVDRGLVGNIYHGRIQRVLPGMQAAFVDIGQDKSAFLFAGDILPREPFDGTSESESSAAAALVPIQELIKPGQTLLVQVVKDAISTKGPRVNCNPSLPGHYVVFVPTSPHIGISRKIVDEAERERLRSILQSCSPPGTGFIARTIAQHVPIEVLEENCRFLVSLWNDIQHRAKLLPAPSLVQPELGLVAKCARDMTNEHLEKIIIDSEEVTQHIQQFVGLVDPKLVHKIEHYKSSIPLFSHYGIENEITRAMSRRVWLRSGGYLVIDQAEALTVIDVNTGRFVGRKNFDETILKTNLEAVREVAFQLRLRNIGGMIIIDFIDMESQADRDKVVHVFEELLKKDRARCNVVKISELGLVEMTRERKRESLENYLREPCSYCHGKGSLKSKQTVCYEVFREISERSWNASEPFLHIHAHPEVIDYIQGHEQDNLLVLESKTGKKITLQPRGSFHQEQFDAFASSTP